MSDTTALLVAVLLLAGNAFFVGAEFALISARRTQIEPLAQQGSGTARVTLRAMERVSLMMAGAQLGITMCSLGLGAIGEPAVAHLIEPGFEALGVPDALVHPVAFAIALAVVVTLHMVVGEMVPKNFALATPERAALILGPPLYAVVWVLRPVIWLLNGIANIVLRLLKVEPKDEVTSTFTEQEVAGFIAQSRREGLLDDDETELLTGALSFTGSTVEKVLLPLDSLVTVEADTTVEELEELCARTGFSRFPVRGPQHDLRGYVHLKDVLDTPVAERADVLPRKRIRSLTTVPVGSTLEDALALMQSRGAHLGRVVEPQTGTALGVIALEDVIEELVGEVVDAQHRA
jgi:CBS domain containing-hemolysin-like protein